MTASIIIGILGGLGTTELIIVLLIIVLLFGAKRIPNLARGFGKGIKEFKDARNGVDTEDDEKQQKI